MIKIFVYAADQQLAEQTVQMLKGAGAEHVEVLGSLQIPARPPKENRYLFICESPAEKLKVLAPKVLPEADYAQDLGQWYEAQSQIVTTATPQKKRSIVVTSGQVVDAKRLLTSINDQWGLSLKVQDSSEPATATREPLLPYLVQKLIEQTPPLNELAIQINTLAGIEDDSIHETDAITGYRELMSQQTDLKHQNQTLENIQADLRAQISVLTDRSQQLANQLSTAQKEKENLALESDSFKQNNLKEITELQARQQSLQNSNSNLDAQLKDTTEENELLLLQLHQVQEELEHYFLKNQETEAKLAKQQARLQRVLKKHPDYIDAESVQVELIDSTTQTLKWVVQGLESQGIAKNYLEFDTFIESGILGIRFNKTNSRNEPTLKNWPASCEGETIDCIPTGKGNVMRQRALALQELSGSDWNLLNTLPQLIKQHLNDTALEEKLSAAVNEGANKITLGINALPKTFRYDAVTLKSSKVNPDYEQLWLVLQGASYGKYQWPKFEFRIGAANIRPGQFSTLPKLEIPLIDGKTKPFDSWYEESYDEYGGKFELRFDINRKIFDVSAWSKLSTYDQRMVLGLVTNLEIVFDELAGAKLAIFRELSDWLLLVSEVRKIMSKN